MSAACHPKLKAEQAKQKEEQAQRKSPELKILDRRLTCGSVIVYPIRKKAEFVAPLHPINKAVMILVVCVLELTKMTLMRILGIYWQVVTGSSVAKSTVGSVW